MASSSSAFVLRRCSNNYVTLPKPHTFQDPGLEDEERQDSTSISSQPALASAPAPAINQKGKGVIKMDSEVSDPPVSVKRARLMKPKKLKKTDFGRGGASPSSSCISSKAHPSSSFSKHNRGVHMGSRRPRYLATSRSCAAVDGDFEELALPLGMSFAALIAQVLEKRNASGEIIPADQLAKTCSAAVNQAVENVYGRRFESFLRNFSKSFCSTLNTLRFINDRQFCESESTSCESSVISKTDEVKSIPVPEPLRCDEELEVCQPTNPQGNQLVLLNGHLNQQLVELSQHSRGGGINELFLNTYEKSVIEQARSNDLKEVEIGLTLRRLQLKQSQLDLSFCSNLLDRVKINMGFHKAQFREEKFKLQMEDTKYAELRRKCIDFLIAGLVIMSAFLCYAAWIYSYRRIADATASCTPSTKEPKPWWFPKQVASFNSGWQILRCQAVVLSRMSFGVLMILVIAYSLLQRSASSGPMMPVSFILLILGVVCGLAGKMCVDTLGGNGYCWLMHWELLCTLHFLVNARPSSAYFYLYGPLTIAQERAKVALPYWIRRGVFYITILWVLPLLSGLLPFASMGEWAKHFSALVQPGEEL